MLDNNTPNRSLARLGCCLIARFLRSNASTGRNRTAGPVSRAATVITATATVWLVLQLGLSGVPGGIGIMTRQSQVMQPDSCADGSPTKNYIRPGRVQTRES